MQQFQLPSPNIGGKGHHLRRIAAQAISYIEVNQTAGKHPNAADLRTFFTACADAVATFDTTPVVPEG